MANNGVDIFEVMSSILEDYDGDEAHEKTRERLLSSEKTRERLSSSEKSRLSSSGSSEAIGTGPIRNDNLQRAKSVKDRWKETKAPTSKL